MWDHHLSIRSALPAACRQVDQPTGALIKDLKQRGLLETTLVHWGGEMGRLPVIQNDAGPDEVGRDHNTYGFSMFLAGGGVKGGVVHGATDDFGHQAVQGQVTHHDYHATLLHLFGLDAAKLTFRHAGREQSLLDGQGGRVVAEILA
jgi:arylsulfatase A-like enzyme